MFGTFIFTVANDLSLDQLMVLVQNQHVLLVLKV